MARGAMKAAVAAARGAREQPNRTPIPRDVSGKGSVYPPPPQAKPLPGVAPGGSLQARPMPGVARRAPDGINTMSNDGTVQTAIARSNNTDPRFMAKPFPQGGEQNSGGMVSGGGRGPMRGPRPDMQQVDNYGGNIGSDAGVSRSFPPSSGPTMDPRQAPGFLPPRLQKQVAAGNMTQAGAENRFQMFQQGQLPGQQGQMQGAAIGAARQAFPGQMGGMAPGGQQADEMMGQQFESLRADGMAGGGMGAAQPPAPMQAGGAAGMGVQMQNPAFREQLKQMLQQRMAGAQPGGGGGGPFGGAPPRYMA